MNVDLAGEFLVMAATLMEIKSRMLLPKPPPPEGEEEGVDPRQELVDRLLEYQRFQEAAGLLREMEGERRRCFPRGGLVDFEPGPSIAIDPESAPVSLLLALRRLLEDADKREDAPPLLRRDRMTLRLKMREIWGALRDAPEGIAFEDLFLHGGGRLEIIATFLAILELLRGGRVRVEQREPLGPMMIQPMERDRLHA
jgi:segregation and condensation protein A